VKDDKTIFLSIIEKNLSKLFSLKNRTAIVTGAASGLGKRIATTLTAVGANVYFADMNKDGITAAIEEVRTLCAFDANELLINVTDPKSVESAFTEVKEKNGRLDILINGAGTSGSTRIEEMNLDLWNRVLSVNLTGTFLCCKEAVKLMVPNRWGRIISIASIAGTHVPRPERFKGGYNYSASKAGVIGLTLRLAAELAPHNITANAISPGFMRSPLTERAFSEDHTLKQTIEATPLGRLGLPSDLDGLVVYLCSVSSEFLTGQDIIIDGGYSIW